ncbi:hypothetical protein ILYODFUR_018846 [Ilyodon furcidens]|uniref:Uncharacterized protein n=1 Tax=Ilyodon furcidens TaxID=33524 RepID=A0ABV0SZB3_9TELE
MTGVFLSDSCYIFPDSGPVHSASRLSPNDPWSWTPTPRWARIRGYRPQVSNSRPRGPVSCIFYMHLWVNTPESHN